MIQIQKLNWLIPYVAIGLLGGLLGGASYGIAFSKEIDNTKEQQTLPKEVKPSNSLEHKLNDGENIELPKKPKKNIKDPFKRPTQRMIASQSAYFIKTPLEYRV